MPIRRYHVEVRVQSPLGLAWFDFQSAKPNQKKYGRLSATEYDNLKRESIDENPSKM